GLVVVSSCYCCQSFVRCAVQIPQSRRGSSWNLRVRRISHRCIHPRQLCMVATRFHLWERTLSLPFHQLVLQFCLTPRDCWLVIKRLVVFGSRRIVSFWSHAAMGLASALPHCTGLVRTRRNATFAES